jgi:nitrate/nitrite transporter NarK
MLGGTFMHVLGLMMASLASDFPQILLAQGVCSALGICAVFQPCMASIPSWFKERRGLAYGIVSSGTSLGGVVFPIMVSRLISSVGFAWSMRISGFLILSLLIISNMTVKPKNPPQSIPMTKVLIARPFNEKSMVLLLIGFFFLTFGVFIPINYIVIQAIDDGMNADLASYLPSLLNAAR